MKLAERPCRQCGKAFRPEGVRIVRCKPCRGDKPRKAPEYRERHCQVCTAAFTPDGPRTRRCPVHDEIPSGVVADVIRYVETLTAEERAALATAADRCTTCTMPVSGPSRWGPDWGGECDRAEHRASSLMSP